MRRILPSKISTPSITRTASSTPGTASLLLSSIWLYSGDALRISMGTESGVGSSKEGLGSEVSDGVGVGVTSASETWGSGATSTGGWLVGTSGSLDGITGALVGGGSTDVGGGSMGEVFVAVGLGVFVALAGGFGFTVFVWVTVGSGLVVMVTVTVGSGCGDWSAPGSSVMVGSLGSICVGSTIATCAASAREAVSGAVASRTTPVRPIDATTADTAVTRTRPLTAALHLATLADQTRAHPSWAKVTVKDVQRH